MVAYRRVFAIGGSAGGVDALLAIAQELPADLPAPILIVIHTSPDSPGYLPDILSRGRKVVAKNALDGELMQDGHIYVARPDHHLIVSTAGKLETPRGPRENRSRPAIDPLFRSVALSFGARAVGIVLSGGLDDGAAGLRAIKSCNGTTVVQDPSDALVDSMPMNALRSTKVDYCLPASGIARLISELATKEPEVGSEKAKQRSIAEGTKSRIAACALMESGSDPPTIPFPTQEPGELPSPPPEPNKPPEPSPIPIDDPAEPVPHPPSR